MTRIADDLVDELKRGDDAVYVCDNFLGATLSAQMRREAEKMYDMSSETPGLFVKSQSIDARQNRIYEKEHVYAMQVMGGNTQYDMAPKLVEYIVHMTSVLGTVLNHALKGRAALSTKLQSNKLAVCTNGGAAYDKHIDNGGAGDLRKISILYYMNPMYKRGDGGCFRAFSSTDSSVYRDIEPVADRLVVFWSDALVHSVTPMLNSKSQGNAEVSVACAGEPLDRSKRRYALTIWLCSESITEIRDLPESVRKLHFPLTN
ncbi:Hypoxia-inducible factor prolyl hydroxylase [Porphyridium purpureum]|uniref:Hypoxia-inducible factor prolyl hydroxylase n=1 Tax=Porphyridium purpureum TaxID=35688 RepID=A0A5J4Z5C3_PORPP|nr:Hypoxia-inducible factor prolyl hydroxylase [Porphyridium purpureum]|eukprot:POR3454..scf295_1